jgi:hypothetical protein
MAGRKLKPSRTGSGAVAFWSIEEKAKALSEKTIIQVVKESSVTFFISVRLCCCWVKNNVSLEKSKRDRNPKEKRYEYKRKGAEKRGKSNHSTRVFFRDQREGETERKEKKGNYEWT